MGKYYSLYNNIKLRKGGRKIAKLSETLFVEKAKSFIMNICKDDNYTIDRISNTEDKNKIIASLTGAVRKSYCDDKSTIHKDFKDIKPDWENYDIVGSLRTVKGCPYIIMNVGGDWEIPICIMAYHDGKQFRCYIPEKGNAYRKDTKLLFGNCDANYDHKSETYIDEWRKSGKTYISDDKYAFDQLVKDGILDKEKDIDKLRGICNHHIKYDINKCIEDFSERVEPISIKESYNKYNKMNMNNTKKRALYESIMKSVSKTVKNKINEMNEISIDDYDGDIDMYLGNIVGRLFVKYAENNPKFYKRIFLYFSRRIFNGKHSDIIKEEYKQNRTETLLADLARATKNGILKPFPDIFVNYYCSSINLNQPSYDLAFQFYYYLLDHSEPFIREIEKYCDEE